MTDDGSASNPRDPVKSSVWNVAVQRRRQKAVMVSKKIRKVLIQAKRLRKVGTKGDDAAEMKIDEEQPILDAHTNIAVEELKSAVQNDHLPKELDPKTIDTSKGDEIVITSSMASSSSGSRRHDVFPSFSGEDVSSSFLSHLLKELYRRLITTFIDHKIERSRPIGPELISAITESRIAIVVFSKNYASSTWCLDELVKIHECYKELDQMVFPIFHNVNPSDVRKQTGDFGKAFKKTCKDKTKDQKQRWIQALVDVANLAGEDLHNGPDEAAVIEKVANDVLNKLITTSDDSDDFVGIEAHIEAMNPILCLESEEARIVGIVGPSGIGKTTIARALFSLLSSQFHHHAFVTYKRTIPNDYSMRSCWEEQFLSDILCQENIKIKKLGVVKQRFKDKKVLIVLDDVNDLELLNTLVGKPGWFGPGSRIIVITQDRWLLKAHEIDRIYEVEFPSEDLALKMLCRSAFGKISPPGGFMELAVEVARLAGNLPLGLSVLGSSLKGRDKDEWVEMLPRLRNNLDGKIEEVLRVGYDRLHRKEQELFLRLTFANLFNGKQVNYVRDLLGDSDDTNTGLKMLVEKSLIRITPEKNVEMHNLLQSLGREIVRAESIDNPGKRRFLVDVEDIRDVFTDKTGTQTVLGIRLDTSDLNQPFFIDENSFEGMHNLQFLICSEDWRRKSDQLYLPQGLTYLPRKLRLLEWYEYPCKCLPFNFKAEFLVELRMENSKLEKLWEGTQPLGSLKRMNMSNSIYLKEIPDLSNAINLEELDLSKCESLVTLPSSIQNAIKLRELLMENCTKLQSLPTLLKFKSLKSVNLKGCFRLRNFPQINLITTLGNCYKIKVEDCLWNKNLHGVDYLDNLMRCIPSQFRPEHLIDLRVENSMLEKLWEGVQSLGSLMKMNLSKCGNLKEIPDLSKATNLWFLKLNNCKSLVTVPSTIGNLNRLTWLEMKGCTGLEVLPTDVNLSSLVRLDLSGCQRLRSFPQISWNIRELYLNDTTIEEVPCCIENFSMLNELKMRGCKRLKNISPNIFRLTRLFRADFSECVEVGTALGDATVVEITEDPFSVFRDHKYGFRFNNCYSLDGDARKLILRSCSKHTFLPGGRVPKYFTHQSSRHYLTVTLPQSSLSQEFLGFKACVVVEPITNPKEYVPLLVIRWYFRGGLQRIYLDLAPIYNTDHLVEVPLKFRNIAPPSELDYNNVEFDFSMVDDDYEPSPFQRIRGCGIRFMEMSPSPASSDGSKKPML